MDNLKLPKYMKNSDEEFYSDAIEKRNKFSVFSEKYLKNDINKILNYIYEFIEKNYKDQIVFWVGGSRSWSIYNKNPEHLSNIQNASIVPGNFDIFILTNNKQAHKEVICLFIEILNKYKIRFNSNQTLNEHYKLRSQYGNILLKDNECTVDYPLEKGTCVLFPCQSLMMSIKSINKEKTEEFPFIDKYKLIVYLESYYVENININLFKQDFITTIHNINYLSIDGLLLFTEFIKTPRKDKGLNVDSIRKKLLTNNFDKNTLYEKYKNVLVNYINIFKDSKEYSNYIVGDLVQNMLSSINKDIKNDVTTYFINIIRPYTNTFVKHMNSIIDKNFSTNAFLVMVGGDAMRRYDYDITTTSDFDVKIYVNWMLNKEGGVVTRSKVKNNNVQKKLYETLIKNMSKLTVFLNNNKNNIFLQSTYKYHDSDDLKVNFKLIENGNQFRLRYIENSKSFPVNLFSIDYKTIVRTQILINNEFHSIDFFISIPFLDFVVQNNDDMKTKKDVVAEKPISDILPIASLKFIIDDLKKIYTIKSLASSRYWNEKRNKDNIRYKLLQLKYNNKEYDYNPKNDLNVLLNENVWNKFLNTDSNSYEREFYKIIDNDHAENIIKHKVHFSVEKSTNDEDKYEDEHEDEKDVYDSMMIDD